MTPSWRDEKLGGKIRAALWLMEEVGEGTRFTKQDMRKAIPDSEQIDRRMRELRNAGWVIRNYKDMPSLHPGDLYLEKVGEHIWEPGKRSAGARTLSAKLRRDVMERDEHCCVRCGVAAGESYPDEPGSRARLTIGHVVPHKYGSAAGLEDLVTECARCNEAVRHLTGVKFSADQMWDQITELRKSEKEALLIWMSTGSRRLSKLELVWARYRQLPAVHRDELRKRLARAMPVVQIKPEAG